MPNYNHAHFIRDAIDSMLVQDYPKSELEFIIIDDGSTDESPRIIQEYAKENPHIKTIFYKENKGIQHVVNHSIDIAQGEYIHWLAADDFRGKNFLSKSMKALLQHPTIGICCSDFGYVNEKTGRSHLLSDALLTGYTAPVAFYPDALLKVLQTTTFWIPGHTTIVKRNSIHKYGRFNRDLREKCDWFLSHQIALHEGIVYIPEVLAYWYIHTNSYSSQSSRHKNERKIVTKEILKVLQKKENQETRKLFYQATLMRWAFWEAPLAFMKPKTFPAFLLFVKRRFRTLSRKLIQFIFRR